MAGLLAPYIPDSGEWFKSAQQGYAQGEAIRNRDLRVDAGGQAAEGDLKGAKATLYEGGDFEGGNQVNQLMRQASDDALKKTEKFHGMLGNLALAADTPEKWSAAVGAAKNAGIDVSKYGDFSARDMVLAQSGKTLEAIGLESDRRKTAAGESKFGVIGQDKFGSSQYGFVNSVAKTVQPVTPSAGGSPQENAANLKGDEFLATLDKPTADQIKALATGRMPIPGGFALKSPYWQNMMQMVSQYDPNFDAVNYNARSKTRNDFTAGKSAQNLASFNTALGHLDTLDKSIDDLRNTDYPAFNAAANAVARQTGDTRYQQSEKKFNAAKQAVVDELTRAFRGSGGNVHDIKGWESTINGADSPSALHAAVKQAADLLHSRIEAVGDQYNRGMGTTSSPLELLSPKAKGTIERLMGTGQASQQSPEPKDTSQLPIDPGARNSPSYSGAVPPAAIQMLKSNPTSQAIQQFDEVFGRGAATKALGR